MKTHSLLQVVMQAVEWTTHCPDKTVEKARKLQATYQSYYCLQGTMKEPAGNLVAVTTQSSNFNNSNSCNHELIHMRVRGRPRRKPARLRKAKTTI
jgi:hypothetical protein